jgi:DNA-directed RNA polymerase specialized sigma24 family protein
MENEFSSQEIENKKVSLKRYRKNCACVRRLEKKLALLEDRITAIKSPNFSGMPRGGKPVTLAELISDKDELEKRIERLKEKGRQIKSEILEEIDTLEDPRYCEILEAYFIDGLSIEDIADKEGYSERRVYRLYSQAINILSVK